MTKCTLSVSSEAETSLADKWRALLEVANSFKLSQSLSSEELFGSLFSFPLVIFFTRFSARLVASFLESSFVPSDFISLLVMLRGALGRIASAIGCEFPESADTVVGTRGEGRAISEEVRLGNMIG